LLLASSPATATSTLRWSFGSYQLGFGTDVLLEADCLLRFTMVPFGDRTSITPSVSYVWFTSLSASAWPLLADRRSRSASDLQPLPVDFGPATSDNRYATLWYGSTDPSPYRDEGSTKYSSAAVLMVPSNNPSDVTMPRTVTVSSSSNVPT
jgi:hypothetical protein